MIEGTDLIDNAVDTRKLPDIRLAMAQLPLHWKSPEELLRVLHNNSSSL